MSYFTSLLNGNVYEVEDIDSTQIPSQILTFGTQECTQQKKGRAINFSTEEDILLVSAWRNISMDPIQGSNQTHQTYWERITAFYDQNKTFSSDRTANSLSHRWSIINCSLSKFIGYYNKVQELNQSGLSEQDKVRDAMTMYSTLQKKTFQLIHCWTELRNCPKFSSTLKKKTRKSPFESPASSASAQSQEIEEQMERPMGKKAAKRLKKIEHDAKDVEFITALNQVKDTMSKLSKVRHEKIQQMIELEKERFKAAEEREKAREERDRAREERDRRMYEMSVLGIDTSTMEAPLVEYYKSLKADILNKRIS
ncbi:glutathione S-transferase T2-like [Apium graveolens]|uniref:glutathione S-transferase T2-like n=1 Tax=Apium graveolens TaxID=4045 RepID=UPI003D7B867B